tara:strand:+ start:241 stop:474 length:234 start_codon:yes stop_codon:yes gene_type:complete
METSLITEYWDQLIALLLVVAAFVKLKQESASLRKDLDSLVKRDTYVEVVRLRAELDAAGKNISALWDVVNALRNKK